MILPFRLPAFVALLIFLVELSFGHPLPPPQHAAPITHGQSRNLITNYSPSLPPSPSTDKIPQALNSQHTSRLHNSRPANKNFEGYITPDVPIEKYSKPTNPLDYSAQKSKKRLSIFSVLHPALHAAFSERSAEWMSGERSSTPVPLSALSDLSSAEYRSAPLRGTEARDRKGIRKRRSFPTPNESTRNNEQPDISIDERPDRRDMSYASQRHDHAPLQSPPYSSLAQRNPSGPSPTSRERGPSSNEHMRPASHLSSTKFSETDVQHNMEAPREVEGLSGRTGLSDDGEKDLRLKDEEKVYDFGSLDRPRVQVDARTKTSEVDQKVPRDELEKAKLKTAMDSLGTVWTQLIATVRRTMDKVKVPVSPSVSPGRESMGTYTSNFYTEQDVTNLINDIMQEIQMHQDEIRAHKEMLKDTGRWDSNDLTQRERDVGVVAPMLVMRTSTLVSPDVLADAVTTSTKKLLLSRSAPVPWSVTSRLLMDLHSRLSEILEPVDTAGKDKRTEVQGDKRNGVSIVDSELRPVRSNMQNQKSDQTSTQNISSVQAKIYPIHLRPDMRHGHTNSVISSHKLGSEVAESASASKP